MFAMIGMCKGLSNAYAEGDPGCFIARVSRHLIVMGLIVGMTGCGDETANAPSTPDVKIVPKVVGQNEARAADTLVEQGFNVNTDYKNDAAPISEVIAQTPDPGSSVKAGSHIRLTVSNGLPVPELTGMTETRAEDTLADTGLGFEPDYTDSKEKIGQVIQQSFEPGELVNSGTSIGVTISNGVAVPDVVGKNKEDALQILEERGLNYKLSRTSSFEPIGQIIDQEIEPPARVNAGTQITLTLSRGISVPDVVGMSEANALEALADVGLSYELNYVDSKKTGGQIVAQDIDPGSHVNSGTLVRLSVSRSGEV